MRARSTLAERSADPPAVRAALERRARRGSAERLAEDDPACRERARGGHRGQPVAHPAAAGRARGRSTCWPTSTTAGPPRGRRRLDELRPLEAARAPARSRPATCSASTTCSRPPARRWPTWPPTCCAAAVAPGRRRPSLAVIGMGKLGGRELNYASDIDMLFVGRRRCRRGPGGARTWPAAASGSTPTCGPRAATARSSAALDVLRGLLGAVGRAVGVPGAAQGRARSPATRARPTRFDAAADAPLWDRPFTADDLRSLRAHEGPGRGRARPPGPRRARGQAGAGRHPRHRVRGAAAPARARPGRPRPALAHHARRARPSWRAAATSTGRRRRARPTPTGSCAGRAPPAARRRAADPHPARRPRPPRRRLARVLGYRGTPDGRRHRGRSTATSPASGNACAPSTSASTSARCSTPSPAPGRAVARRGRGTALAAFGFTDAERTRQAVRELTRGLTRSSRLMQQLLPLLLDWLSAAPDPDLGLLGLRKLASGDAAHHRAGRRLPGSPRGRPPPVRCCWAPPTLLGDMLGRQPRPDRAAGRAAPPARPAPGRPAAGSARRALGWRTELGDRQQALLRWRRRHLLRHRRPRRPTARPTSTGWAPT